MKRPPDLRIVAICLLAQISRSGSKRTTLYEQNTTSRVRREPRLLPHLSRQQVIDVSAHELGEVPLFAESSRAEEMTFADIDTGHHRIPGESVLLAKDSVDRPFPLRIAGR